VFESEANNPIANKEMDQG